MFYCRTERDHVLPWLMPVSFGLRLLSLPFGYCYSNKTPRYTMRPHMCVHFSGMCMFWGWLHAYDYLRSLHVASARARSVFTLQHSQSHMMLHTYKHIYANQQTLSEPHLLSQSRRERDSREAFGGRSSVNIRSAEVRESFVDNFGLPWRRWRV